MNAPDLTAPVSVSTAKPLPVSRFSMALGLSGLAYAWLNAARLWGLSRIPGEAQLCLTLAVWTGLAVAYARQHLRNPEHARREFDNHAVGSMGALIGIATLVLVPGLAMHSRIAAWTATAFGIGWHLLFALRP